MINTQPYKAMYKSELARAAGVSYGTFNRWLLQHKEELQKLNCTPYCKILNPRAVEFVCNKYGITFDD